MAASFRARIVLHGVDHPPAAGTGGASSLASRQKGGVLMLLPGSLSKLLQAARDEFWPAPGDDEEDAAAAAVDADAHVLRAFLQEGVCRTDPPRSSEVGSGRRPVAALQSWGGEIANEAAFALLRDNDVIEVVRTRRDTSAAADEDEDAAQSTQAASQNTLTTAAANSHRSKDDAHVNGHGKRKRRDEAEAEEPVAVPAVIAKSPARKAVPAPVEMVAPSTPPPAAPAARTLSHLDSPMPPLENAAGELQPQLQPSPEKPLPASTVDDHRVKIQQDQQRLQAQMAHLQQEQAQQSAFMAPMVYNQLVQQQQQQQQQQQLLLLQAQYAALHHDPIQQMAMLGMLPPDVQATLVHQQQLDMVLLQQQQLAAAQMQQQARISQTPPQPRRDSPPALVPPTQISTPVVPQTARPLAPSIPAATTSVPVAPATPANGPATTAATAATPAAGAATPAAHGGLPPTSIQLNFFRWVPSGDAPGAPLVCDPLVSIRMKKRSPLSKGINAYCQFRHLDAETYAFYRPSRRDLTQEQLKTDPALYDTRLDPARSPQQLEWDGEQCVLARLIGT